MLEQDNKVIDELEVIADAVENSDRKVVLTKVRNAYHLYKELVQYYTSIQLVEHIKKNNATLTDLVKKLTRCFCFSCELVEYWRSTYC